MDQESLVADRFRLWAAAAIFSACVPRAAVTEGLAAPVIVVDAFAPPGGDGTTRAPYRTLPEGLAVGARVQLRSGLYRGPFRVPDGVWLEGQGEAVLYVEGMEAIVLEAQGQLRLTSLSIQGGAVGLKTRGRARLDRVHFSGHHVEALKANEGAAVEVADSVFDGLTSNSNGVVLTAAALHLERTKFTGGYGRAVEATGSKVTVNQSSFEGPRTALHAVDSVSAVAHSLARSGAGAAFFASKGSMRLEDVQVEGHEYAVQTGADTTLTVEGFSSKGALVAGLGLVQTKATISKLALEASGLGGALQAIESQLELSYATITDARSTAVLVRKGTALLREIEIVRVHAETDGDGTRSLGDGLHLRDATVTLRNITVRDAEGTSVFVSAHARVTIDQFTSARAREGALVVERGSSVDAKDVRSSETVAAAVAVIDGATLRIERLTVVGSELPLWAECSEGVTVTVRAMSPAPKAAKHGRCVTIRP